jgi:acyl-CoA synthetase (AMP-forming)/AMP-acid ligase II
VSLVPAKPPAGSVRDWLDRRARETPDRVSHIFAEDESRLTWAELQTRAAAIAGRLAGLGIAKGESVALCLANGRDAVLCLFGTLYGGFRATALNLVAGPEAMGYAIGHSRARFVFVGEGQRQVFEAALARHPSLPAAVSVLAVNNGIDWPAAGETAALEAVNEGDQALLMYTSGTTGRPKGVVHSQASLLAGGWTTALAHRLSAVDRALCVLPYFHINGLCVTLMGPLVSGGSVVVAEKFSASRFWQQCGQFEATWCSVVPTIISHLLHAERAPAKAVVERLRFARSASSALAPQVQTAFEERFGIAIVETMGLTETAAQILANPRPPGLRKVGSPGLAIGNEARIVGARGRAGTGEQGEIAVRGPNVMLEYLDDPEATRETFTADGWLLTGDLGHMDRDGYVFVTGRRKELIIKGGENIAPREVDEALYSHPDVVEAAAFGRTCQTYGQRVAAAVKLKPGAKVSEADLLAICRNRLGAFKCPDAVFFLDELPKGPSGKIQRLKLAADLTR